MRLALFTLAIPALLAATLALPAAARDLTIGRSTEQTSMDPHYVLLGNDTSTAENIFDRLVRTDPDLKHDPSPCR